MAVPWLRLVDAALGMTDLARRVTRRPPEPGQDLTAGATGPLEARLAGVVVAALKEAFDRDTRRLELEREHVEGERIRAERALRMELRRQAGDRDIGRLRLIAGVAVVSWLGTLFFSAELMDGSPAARGALGVGWVLLLIALGAAFAAQSSIARQLAADGEISGGLAGSLAPWLIIAGLAAIGLGVLIG